jgi:hypothetical protein
VRHRLARAPLISETSNAMLPLRKQPREFIWECAEDGGKNEPAKADLFQMQPANSELGNHSLDSGVAVRQTLDLSGHLALQGGHLFARLAGRVKNLLPPTTDP